MGEIDPKVRAAKIEGSRLEVANRERDLEYVSAALEAELSKKGLQQHDLSEQELTDQALIRLQGELATAQSNLAQEQSRLASYETPVESNTDPFYAERGVNLISVEVLKFKCSNKDTDLTLQEIIKETADRLKKKEYQQGENEV